MVRLRHEDGFALPLTIFVITIVTVMLAGVLIRVQIDRRIAESSGDMIDALTVAQSGLQRYLGLASSRPGDGDSIRINVQGGFADVVVRAIEQPVDSMAEQLFIVRSTGHVIRPTQGSDPQASRTVAQFAAWQTGWIKVMGAYTAAHKVTELSGGTVDINGSDGCSAASPVYGVRAPNGSSLGAGIVGSPTGFLIDGSSGAVADATRINWDGVINGPFVPDHYAFRAWDAGYPSMLINGNLTLQDTGGYGLLIVTGDLTLGGMSTSWDGVILVGGRINFGSQYTVIYGLVTSGLNSQFGGSVSAGQFGGSGKTVQIRYNSCSVAQALQPLTGFAPVAKGWVDDWATY